MNTPLYLQIAWDIKNKILTGQIEDGTILPSERRMAELWKVHRNTVTKAYSELKAEEYITSQRGIGYKVAYRKDQVKKRRGKVNWEDAIKDEYLDMEHSFDEIFATSYASDTISFAGGISSPTVYGYRDIKKCYGEIVQKQRERAYFFTPYQGDESLRQHICYYLRGRGIRVNKGHLQIMSEINQALDFLVTLLISPGDRVIVEEPVSPDVYRPIELAGAKLITVPMDQDGMICDNLEPLVEKHRPKFIYVSSSSYHDPTGVTMSIQRKRKLLEVSEKYHVPIIEEDNGSEIYFDDPPPLSLKSMDKTDSVIYIYSFSLTFVPGAGMAFVAGPQKLIKSLRYLVSMRLVSLDWVSQKLLDVAMESKIYDEKLPVFRQEYKAKRDKMCAWLNKLAPYGVEYNIPEGGVYIWCRLPDKVDLDQLIDQAKKQGVSVMPGKIFFPHKKGGRHNLRLNYSYVSLEDMDRGLTLLGKLILAHLNID